MRKLLIATHNPAKREEYKDLLSDNDIKVLSLDDLNITKDVEETGQTFVENAHIKAVFYHKLSGLCVLADDGGLEIDYLNGAPGVKSKRWIGGKETSDEELIAYTISQMKGVTSRRRGASFRVALVYINEQGKEFVAQTCVRGVIAQKALERNLKKGFPFRQVLYIPEIGKYYNSDEMTVEENDQYNNRKHALEQLRPHIFDTRRVSK